jgi:enoyl-CoA hydratase/carnithine racemase
MSEPSLVLVSIEGAIARFTLNRPAAANTLSIELVSVLRSKLAAMEQRNDVKVIILSGAGGRIFCAGHDLNEFTGAPSSEFLRRDFEGLASLMQAIIAQPQIMIAKVEGVATAAGCELVAACDLAFASTEARFAVPGVNIGFWCHTPQIMLSRTVGRKAAMQMLSTGALFPAQYALSIGLVNEVCAAQDLDAVVDAQAELIASKSRAILTWGKRAFLKQSDKAISEAYDLAVQDAVDNIGHSNAQEGIAAFIEKRPPDWSKT